MDYSLANRLRSRKLATATPPTNNPYILTITSAGTTYAVTVSGYAITFPRP